MRAPRHPIALFRGRLQQIRRFIVLAVFLANTIGPMPLYAQDIQLPAPGAMVHLSAGFTAAQLQGITIHPENPFQFDFLIDRGDQELNAAQKRVEYKKLVKYFLASLTIPDQDQWVNLSPYEHDRIIQTDFGRTGMGRDLLAEDYMLKQITASLIYPQGDLGRKFWDGVYRQAWQKYHTNHVPVNTFNKVWIVPDHAYVYESGNTAYILKSHLKVMLEEDYLSLAKHSGSTKPANSTHTIGSQLMREIILPALEKEVNEGRNFAALRQMYSGMVLATWYKRALKESLLGKIYVDKDKVMGVNQDPEENQLIYQRYLEAFKKGVFNYIKDDVDKYTNQEIPRKYFSGGFTRKNLKLVIYGPSDRLPSFDPAVLASSRMDRAMVDLTEATSAQTGQLTESLADQLLVSGERGQLILPEIINYWKKDNTKGEALAVLVSFIKENDIHQSIPHAENELMNYLKDIGNRKNWQYKERNLFVGNLMMTLKQMDLIDQDGRLQNDVVRLVQYLFDQGSLDALRVFMELMKARAQLVWQNDWTNGVFLTIKGRGYKTFNARVGLGGRQKTAIDALLANTNVQINIHQALGNYYGNSYAFNETTPIHGVFIRFNDGPLFLISNDAVKQTPEMGGGTKPVTSVLRIDPDKVEVLAGGLEYIHGRLVLDADKRILSSEEYRYPGNHLVNTRRILLGTTVELNTTYLILQNAAIRILNLMRMKDSHGRSISKIVADFDQWLQENAPGIDDEVETDFVKMNELKEMSESLFVLLGKVSAYITKLKDKTRNQKKVAYDGGQWLEYQGEHNLLRDGKPLDFRKVWYRDLEDKIWKMQQVLEGQGAFIEAAENSGQKLDISLSRDFMKAFLAYHQMLNDILNPEKMDTGLDRERFDSRGLPEFIYQYSLIPIAIRLEGQTNEAMIAEPPLALLVGEKDRLIVPSLQKRGFKVRVLDTIEKLMEFNENRSFPSLVIFDEEHLNIDAWKTLTEEIVTKALQRKVPVIPYDPAYHVLISHIDSLLLQQRHPSSLTPRRVALIALASILAGGALAITIPKLLSRHEIIYHVDQTGHYVYAINIGGIDVVQSKSIPAVVRAVVQSKLDQDYEDVTIQTTADADIRVGNFTVKLKKGFTRVETIRKGEAIPSFILDKAQTAVSYGGIDFNATHLKLGLKRDGRGVSVPLIQQDLAQLSGLQGFEPEIIEIRPALNVPILNELQEKLQNKL